MKKATYLLILIVVLFACNRNIRERNAEIEIFEYQQSIINPELLRVARWTKAKNELNNYRAIFYEVVFTQRNDSNFVFIQASALPPLRFYEPVLIGFTNIEKYGLILTEEDKVWIAEKSSEVQRKIYLYDYFTFFGKNISDDFLTAMVQYDALNTCQEEFRSLLLSLGDYLNRFSLMPPPPPFFGFVFFVNEQGDFILKQTFQ